MSLIKRATAAWQVLTRGLPGPEDDFWYNPVYQGRTASPSEAMQVSAVWACVQILAGDVAKTPLLVYRRLDGEDQERLDSHYLADRLQRTANEITTAHRFKHLMEMRRLLYGNAYAEIILNERGQVSELLPWHPARTEVEVSSEWAGPIYHYTTIDGRRVTRPWASMLHIRGIVGDDGVSGMSPIRAAARTVKLAIAAEEHGAAFYLNGARPGGILTLPTAALRDAASKEEIRREWEKAYGGPSRANRTAILTEGSKYETVSIPQTDAEYIATRKMGILDICRIYGVPPHKVAELDRATFSNIEEQQLDYLAGTLGAEFGNWVSECQFSLLSEREARQIYLEFDTRHLLRMRLREQIESLGVAVDKGLMTRNEARAELNLNRMTGADSLLVQQQMVPLEKLEEIHAANANTQPSA